MAKCKKKCEIYSRVTGYMRPVNSWNKGKKEEFKERKAYSTQLAAEKVKVA
ncbi:MAG: anaerobic ribonucleoside-triphosphate reductase [Victivallales bacterium]|nr:anaerobic ribonucleoside-triphosphate reductase [Victivallales bacterium]